jgi:general secretion pathway protein A
MNTHPFSVSPNPSNLYMTPGLAGTIHKCRFVIDNRQGLTVIMGDVGMGKSSVLRLLYGEYAARPDVVATLIPSPSFVSEFAFLKGVCQDLNLRPRRSLYDQEQELRGFLASQFAENVNIVVFIDEAQRLKGAQLEMVRTFLNFETNQFKLIQIVLAAQMELRDSLKDPSKKALRSRIIAPSILAPLTPDETKNMVEYRCQQSGISNPFPDETMKRIYTEANGVPREVLKICSVAYELMKATGVLVVSPELIESAIGEAVIV